mgnify:FL=1
MLSRRKIDIIYVNNFKGTPLYFPMIALLSMLLPGYAKFTCCECNHRFVRGVVRCDREIAIRVIDTMSDAKVRHLIRQMDLGQARRVICMKHIWMKGFEDILASKEKIVKKVSENRDTTTGEDDSAVVKEFMKLLYWCPPVDVERANRTGMTLLK